MPSERTSSERPGCERTLLVQRLAVEDPAALRTPPWRIHLEHCADCRQEQLSLSRSLAVFRQIEAQPPPRGLNVPSWERFSRTLQRGRRGRWSRLGVRVPLAAASLLAAVSTGVLLWPIAEQSAPPRPARVVTLKPEQAVHLQRVMQRSLNQVDVAGAAGRSTHETPDSAATKSEPARFVVQELRLTGLEAQFATPRVSAPVRVAAAPSRGTQERVTPVAAPIFGNGRVADRREQIPVLLFRSLKQRESRRSPIQAMPVQSPSHNDSATSFQRFLNSPHPIR